MTDPAHPREAGLSHKQRTLVESPALHPWPPHSTSRPLHSTLDPSVCVCVFGFLSPSAYTFCISYVSIFTTSSLLLLFLLLPQQPWAISLHPGPSCVWLCLCLALSLSLPPPSASPTASPSPPSPSSASSTVSTPLDTAFHLSPFCVYVCLVLPLICRHLLHLPRFLLHHLFLLLLLLLLFILYSTSSFPFFSYSCIYLL